MKRALHLPLNYIPGIFKNVIGFGCPFMICSPLLAKQYFPGQQKFLGPPLQVNQQVYAKQAKNVLQWLQNTGDIVSMFTVSSFQVTWWRTFRHNAYDAIPTVVLLLAGACNLVPKSPGRFSMALEVAPPPKPWKSAPGTRLWGMQMLQ